MKIKNLLLVLVYCFVSYSAKSQIKIPPSQSNIVKLNCHDSLGFITNQGGASRACEFYFDKNKSPIIFYAKDFSHQDFHNLIYKNDRAKIKRVKVVMGNYQPSVHDFVFAYN